MAHLIRLNRIEVQIVTTETENKMKSSEIKCREMIRAREMTELKIKTCKTYFMYATLMEK